MNITNKEIRAKARHLLDENIFGKNWLKSIVITLLMMGIVGVTGGLLFTLSNALLLPALMGLIQTYAPNSKILIYVIPIILDILEIMMLNIFIGPLSVGLVSVHLDLVRHDGDISIRKFFDGFKEFLDNFLVGFMYVLHITLWTLLFIIPGIYVSYSYAMVFHVRKDHPDYRWQQCFDESERLMEGNRWRLFKLHMSFIGWAFLGSLAFCGLGSLWVTPYEMVSTAVFYEEIKNAKDSNIVSFDTKIKKSPDPVVVDLSKNGGAVK
ncbi:MAG: DUF975 family protein [Eubacteriales bacterium]